VTAPTFQSAATSTDGSTVTLTYDETLSSTTAATTDFEVTTDSDPSEVTEVAVSGATVELTLTTPVFKDQSVTVAYTDPSGSNDADAVQDSAGNDAASLSATTVTNNSTYVQGLQVELYQGVDPVGEEHLEAGYNHDIEETIDLDDSYDTNGDGDEWSIRAQGEIQAYATGTNTSLPSATTESASGLTVNWQSTTRLTTSDVRLSYSNRPHKWPVVQHQD